MKFFIKLVMVVMFLVLGGAYLFGRRLPREHVVTSSIVLVTEADTVFRLIRNIEASPSWWSDVKSVERIAGARRESWRQSLGASGTIEIEVSGVTSGRAMEVTILNAEEQGWGGTWYYEVADTPAGTEVTITEEGFVDSPIFRTLMQLRGKYRTIDSFLSSLGAHFGESATPRHG
ncbi:MAG TPA: SRPBCC family protein [Gemmatimonadaceae bacterium]|nr:SRPBCC family protein [Gemmatimonadaceae bacterium]HRQ77701.1 SRPBCC family protein [Gemmatimonadaceae bacterium]